MDDTSQHSKTSFTKAGRSLVFALIGHIQDPETGERLSDDPQFRAAAGIADKPSEKAA